MNTKIKLGAAAILATACCGTALAAEKWMTGDFHQHTWYTDGSYPMNDLLDATTITSTAVTDAAVRATLHKKGVMPQGFFFGLDFQANSEHGGVRARDGFGNNWTTYSPLPSIGDPNPPANPANMWRWQSLIQTLDIPNYSGPAYMGAYDWILGIRANYPDKLALTGMEWNPPGHEHSSSGIWAGDAKAIAEFEYRFDKSDTDGTSTTTTATTMGWAGKLQNTVYVNPPYPDYSTILGLNPQHEKTLDAVKWMQANYPNNGYIVPAHVERAGCGVNAWSIAAFRDLNDNGSTVFFGFEGIPGHEKSSNRGEFGTGACGGGTYGGAGTYVATVSGLWDNLLADGRKFYNFASSDFHNDAGADFWPGEYLKTYVKVKDANNDGNYTQDEVLSGLRSGNVYSVHGDLINELDYKVLFKTPYGTKNATMGETLSIRKGNKVTVQIRFKTPLANNCLAGTNASPTYVCQPPSVHHVQLIQGKWNLPKATKLLNDDPAQPNPDFNAIDPTVASVVATFDATGGDLLGGSGITSTAWTTDAQGYTTMTFTVPSVQNDMFFRIRGSNLGYGVTKMSGTNVVYGNDAAGNPLKNTPGTNSADMAWDDLWFYSNPIFVKAL